MEFRENEHLFLGIPILLLSFFGLAWNAFRLYQYNFSDKFFLFIVSNKLLLINGVLTVLGIVLGVETMKKNAKITVSLFLFLSLLVIYIILNIVPLNW